MEIKSTDPTESGSPAADLSEAIPEATESSTSPEAEPPASEPVSSAPPIAPDPEIAPDPFIAQDPVVPPAPTPTASEAIAERIQVASTASSDDTSSGGGEWDLLSSKVRQWWDSNNLFELWQRSRRPLFLVLGLIGLTLLFRIYGGILAAIGTIPLAARLFELIGLIWLIWFSSTRLIRSEERKALLENIGGIWAAFRGSVRP